MDFKINQIVQMKKYHPCTKSNEFKILRFGVDIKCRCQGCNSIIIIQRDKFEKKIKKEEK